MPIQDSYCLAGRFTDPDGTNWLLVGSGLYESFSAVLNLDTLSWETRSAIPFSVSETAVVPYHDSFLVVGGYNENDYGTILYYHPVFEWQLLDQRLQKMTFRQTVFTVTNKFAYCE